MDAVKIIPKSDGGDGGGGFGGGDGVRLGLSLHLLTSQILGFCIAKGSSGNLFIFNS